MSSAWLLPEHIADVLPARARQVEKLRRGLLDAAESFGFELVIPPMLEHIESLLSGTGHALDLQTFKLVDQLSGRTLGLRADSTPQVARIDAHLLNRSGVARLCYCGPVLHTRATGTGASREPLQFGAEIYGHAGLEADIEILDLALECLGVVGLKGAVLDLADTRIVRAVLAGVPVDAARLDAVHAALASKDAAELAAVAKGFPAEARRGLEALLSLYGDASILDDARRVLPARAAIAHRARRAAAARRSCRRGPARREDRLRPRRFERLRLLQRRPLRGLRRGRERRDRPRRPLRRGRRDLRPHPAGGRLRPRRQGSGRARAAGGAPGRRSALRARATPRCAARCGNCGPAARSSSASCPGDRGDEAGFVFDRSVVARLVATG